MERVERKRERRLFKKKKTKGKFGKKEREVENINKER